jgi:hypothetical protein
MNLRTIAPGLMLVGLFTLLQSTTSRGQEAIGSATSVKRSVAGPRYERRHRRR